LAKVIGRDEFIAGLVEDMVLHRLITVAGPGGIGKTTAALGAARQAIIEHVVDAVALVDIENVENAALLPSAFRAGLGVAATTSNPIADILSFLDNRRILVVLDSCEGMIGPVARLVEEILGHAPNTIVLVTSREPLRATGERIRRLDALGFPIMLDKLTVELAMEHAAIELFVDRAASSQPSFMLTDENVGIVADICRRLDGVPLSLEIAAARLDSFDLPVLASVLDTYFRLQMLGRSTALARHRTLAAAIDWSYDTLAPNEQTALRRLSVFRGPFCFEAARSIVQCERIAAELVGDLIARLAAKSMIVAGGGYSQGLHRLMDTTRVYAFQKLEQSGESDAVRRKHARHYSLSIALQAENKSLRSSAAWLGYCASVIHQIQSGMDWAASAHGDFDVACDLAIAAIPVWATLGLGDECMSQISHILAAPSAEPSTRQRLSFAIAHQNMIKNTAARSEDLRRNWSEIADLAAKITDPRLELQAIYGVMIGSRAIGNLTEALVLADQFRRVALANKLEQFLPLADVLAGSILFALADFEQALQATKAGLSDPQAVVAQGYEMNDACDYLVLGSGNLAMLQLVRGETDAALETCARNVARALSLEADPFICQATGASAVWVCIETNNLDLAEHYTALWLERSAKPALEIWHLMAEGVRAILKSQKGEHEEAVTALSTTLNALRHTWGVSFRNIVLRYLAQSLMATGNPEGALAALDEAIEQATRCKESWSLSLLLAMRAKVTLHLDESGSHLAATEFHRAFDLAESQGAKFWTARIGDIVQECCDNFQEFAKAWNADQDAESAILLRGIDREYNPPEVVAIRQ
jgi:predicted ATPase